MAKNRRRNLFVVRQENFLLRKYKRRENAKRKKTDEAE